MAARRPVATAGPARRWPLLALVLATFAAQNALADPPVAVIPGGHEAFFLGMVDQTALEECGWTLETVAVEAADVRYGFSHRDGGRPARPGVPPYSIVLSHPSRCDQPVAGPAGSFCVAGEVSSTGERAGRCGESFLVAVVTRGVETASGRFDWLVPQAPPPPRGTRSDDAPRALPIQQHAMVVLILILLISAIVSVARSRWWKVVPKSELVGLATCLAIGLFLRLLADPFPGDIRLTLGMDSSEELHWWSAGYAALQQALFAIFPPSFDTLRLANVAFGTLTITSLYAFVALYVDDGVGGEPPDDSRRRAALGAAAAYACYPIAARFAASDAAHVPLALAFITAGVFTASWARRGGLFRMLQAAGWLALCGNLRPEAVVYLPALLLVIIGLQPSLTRGRLVELGIGALAVAALVLSPSFAVLEKLEAPGSASYLNFLGLAKSPFIFSPHSPLAFILAGTLGFAALLLKRDLRWRTICWLIALAFVAMPSWFRPVSPHTDMLHRHTLPLLAGIHVLVGYGLATAVTGLGLALARVRPRGPRADSAATASPLPALARRAALILIPLLGSLPEQSFLHRAWTPQLELDFIRSHLPQVEDGCTIVRHWRGHCDAGLHPPEQLSRETDATHTWMDIDAFLDRGADTACVVFYQGATCHSQDEMDHNGFNSTFPPCRAIADGFALLPIAEAELPARPYVGERYTRDPVPVGFYRLDPCEGNGGEACGLP